MNDILLQNECNSYFSPDGGKEPDLLLRETRKAILEKTNQKCPSQPTDANSQVLHITTLQPIN